MRSKSRQYSRLTFHPIVIASAIVFTVLFLALGYHTGVTQVEKAYQPRMNEVIRELGSVSKTLTKCNAGILKLTKEFTKTDSRAGALNLMLAELRKEQQAEEAAYSALDRENTKCEMDRTELDTRIRDFNEKDEEARRNVEETAKEVDALEVSILHLTRGDGMSVVLLNEVVSKLRDAYEAKCRTVPGCVERSNDELLKLHIESNHSEEEIKAFLQRDAAAQKSLVNDLQDESANLTGIYFLPPVEEEGQWSAKEHYPTYFHRTITQKPLRGVQRKSEASPTALTVQGNVMDMLNLYGDYAMCAYRRNNSEFSFQSVFNYKALDMGTTTTAAEPPTGSPSTAAYLHRLLVSPLLQYCVGCDAKMWSETYRLACFKDRLWALGNYGTREFWTVRSMIQAAPSVQTAALSFYERHEAEEVKVLAVVLHLASERDREACDRAASREYGIHYQYLMANFPNDAALRQHIAEERQAQCAPTAAQIIERIEKVLMTSVFHLDRIYLSVSEETRSNIMALLKQDEKTELLGMMMPAYTDPKMEEKAPGFTELVDLEIASRATDILVSPFMLASRYTTEEFLLRHRLNPGGHIWVF